MARRLISKDPEQATEELKDVQQTARTALNEVRQLVSQMRGIRLNEEIVLVRQILKAAEIEFIFTQEKPVTNVSLFLENILSMCIKEAITNVVKHSQATVVQLTIKQSQKEITIIVQDDGVGLWQKPKVSDGHGLVGMKERLDFVNGSLQIVGDGGTKLIMKVPLVHISKEEDMT